MSFLIERNDGRALVLDAGTGISRLGRPEVARRLDRCTQLDLVLTHYHLDHVIGLAWLGGLWNRPCRIFAPTGPLVDTTPSKALGRLIAPPLFPATFAEFPQPIEVIPYSGDFEIDGLIVRVRRQAHPGGSVGLRLGDQLAYITDTVADGATIGFVDHVSWLLHEVWCDREEARVDPSLVRGHCAGEDALDIARDASAQYLIPVHHHPKRDAEQLAAFVHRLAESARQARGLQLLAALDGDTVAL
jgi:ribonuclease BN (tRNA processing enzyme)